TLLLINFVTAQQSNTNSFPAALGSYAVQSLQQTTPKPYFPPAQVHYVNIGEDLAGDYKFGYDTGKSNAGQSFREESRLPDGTVKGAYGYIDAEGKQRIVKYTAGVQGFKVESDEEAPGQSSPSSVPRSVPTSNPQLRPYKAIEPVPLNNPQTQTQSAPQTPVQSITLRQYQPRTSSDSVETIRLSQIQPVQSSYRNVNEYTPVAHTTSITQPQYVTSIASPASADSPLNPIKATIVRNSGSQYASSLPSSLSNFQETSGPSSQQLMAAALARHLTAYTSRVTPSLASTSPQTITALLAQQRSASDSNIHHLGSVQRNPPLSFPVSGSPYTSALSSQSEPETTTWGPPVINKELLSYNIGVQQR
ncbi:hypothetical protein QR98_0095620, partial [Sarcoptes scabiei]